MAPASYSRRARKDLLELWRWYAEKGGITLADAILDRIQHRISGLNRFPEMGPSRPDIAPTARLLVVHRWLILYEFANDRIRIVRVVDGAVDLRREVWTE